MWVSHDIFIAVIFSHCNGRLVLLGSLKEISFSGFTSVLFFLVLLASAKIWLVVSGLLVLFFPCLPHPLV